MCCWWCSPHKLGLQLQLNGLCSGGLLLLPLLAVVRLRVLGVRPSISSPDCICGWSINVSPYPCFPGVCFFKSGYKCQGSLADIAVLLSCTEVRYWGADGDVFQSAFSYGGGSREGFVGSKCAGSFAWCFIWSVLFLISLTKLDLFSLLNECRLCLSGVHPVVFRRLCGLNHCFAFVFDLYA